MVHAKQIYSVVYFCVPLFFLVNFFNFFLSYPVFCWGFMFLRKWFLLSLYTVGSTKPFFWLAGHGGNELRSVRSVLGNAGWYMCVYHSALDSDGLSHSLSLSLSLSLLSVSVRLCEQTLNSSGSAITKYAEQEDKKQNTWLCWCFDLLLYAIFVKKKVQISVWLKTCSLLQQTVVQECLSWVYFLSLVSDQMMVSWAANMRLWGFVR